MKILPLIFITCIFSIACNNVSEKEYENSKEKMMEKEMRNPVDFLSVSHTGKRNLFGQTVVRGIIRSNASVSSYENVRVKMLYYNQEGALVENHEEVIKGVLAPKSTLNFKAKYFTPKGTDSVALSIMEADAIKDKDRKN